MEKMTYSGPVYSQNLKNAVYRGVKLIVSDGHKGIQKAIEASFLGASWQISLTKVSESFDGVETCVMFTSCELY
jgi:transposase-like protein